MVQHYMPRVLMKSSAVSGTRSFGSTNVYIQNNYGTNYNGGGLWNGYFQRTSSYNSGTPVTMDPRYYGNQYSYGGYGYGCNMPHWTQQAVEGNFVFDFLKGVFGGGNGNGNGGCFC
ncbi:hypothetical protein IKP85_05085 [bacterium]|nr:hypothetical protein [bacterium]